MPFLVTAALMPATSSAQEAPPPLKKPIMRNPPPPQHVKPKPPPIKTIETADGKRITRRRNGTCWQSFKTSCPEGARCNPPPPRPVECPAELSLGLPTQIKEGDKTTWRRPDGRCESMFNIECEEGSTCNPPPPQPTPCPDALVPAHMRKSPATLAPPVPPKFAPPPPPKRR